MTKKCVLTVDEGSIVEIEPLQYDLAKEFLQPVVETEQVVTPEPETVEETLDEPKEPETVEEHSEEPKQSDKVDEKPKTNKKTKKKK